MSSAHFCLCNKRWFIPSDQKFDEVEEGLISKCFTTVIWKHNGRGLESKVDQTELQRAIHSTFEVWFVKCAIRSDLYCLLMLAIVHVVSGPLSLFRKNKFLPWLFCLVVRDYKVWQQLKTTMPWSYFFFSCLLALESAWEALPHLTTSNILDVFSCKKSTFHHMSQFYLKTDHFGWVWARKKIS